MARAGAGLPMKHVKHTRYTVYTVLYSIFTNILSQGVTQGEKPHKKLHTVLQNGYIPGTVQHVIGRTWFQIMFEEVICDRLVIKAIFSSKMTSAKIIKAVLYY